MKRKKYVVFLTDWINVKLLLNNVYNGYWIIRLMVTLNFNENKTYFAIPFDLQYVLLLQLHTKHSGCFLHFWNRHKMDSHECRFDFRKKKSHILLDRLDQEDAQVLWWYASQPKTVSLTANVLENTTSKDEESLTMQVQVQGNVNCFLWY